MWRRQQPYWHAVFAIVWLAAVVVTLLDDPGPHGRAPSLALLGVIAVAYAVLGTRAMTSRDLRWAVAYQVVAWAALLGIQWVDPGTQASGELPEGGRIALTQTKPRRLVNPRPASP